MGRPKKVTPEVEKAPLRLPGTFDVVPESQVAFQFFMDKFVNLAQTFGYTRVDTPMVEDAKLFRFWEESTTDQLLFVDVETKSGKIAIKPTNLFSLARVYLEHRYFEKEKVSKWYYTSPTMVVSQGELKQTNEIGIQVFGDTQPVASAQLINLMVRLLTDLGLQNFSLEVNSIGCLECLPAYRDVIKTYFKDKKYDLCEECIEHLDNNPIKIFACNNLSCNTAAAEAPVIVDYLDENCRKHFIGVLEGLDELGLPYNLSPKVVGDAWSRRTIFEIKYRTEAGDLILGSGGHADDLIQSLGGVPTQALGFKTSLETIMLALAQSNLKFTTKTKTDVFLVPLGDLAAKKTLRLFSDLWSNDIAASEFIGPGSIKTQLKLAESSKVSIALIIGQKEAREGTVILRDVRSGMQELFTVERIIEEVKKRLGR